MSGAGERIDDLMREMDTTTVRSDGGAKGLPSAKATTILARMGFG